MIIHDPHQAAEIQCRIEGSTLTDLPPWALTPLSADDLAHEGITSDRRSPWWLVAPIAAAFAALVAAGVQV